MAGFFATHKALKITGIVVAALIVLGVIGNLTKKTAAPKSSVTTSTTSATTVPPTTTTLVSITAAPTIQATTPPTTSRPVVTTPTTRVLPVATTAAPPPTTASPVVSCHPLTNTGKCYEPGETCRASDQGVTGVAGDGETIKCEDNNGLRWEPI